MDLHPEERRAIRRKSRKTKVRRGARHTLSVDGAVVSGIARPRARVRLLTANEVAVLWQLAAVAR